ncbi:MAG TPA: DNA primase [Lentisphaeria bacterium]|nr:MAG: DNA primase [Lentisphaerae bacterium GWF2_38_69]HBM16386.1 DNA primase [Lentisphaeria bacterium]
MPYISDEIISQIRSKTDITDIILPYAELKKSGSRLKALCPFHNEKTPSFVVSRETQSFHCFGCGKGGNVFTFLMEKENLTFPEAAKILADRCGILIPEENSSSQSQSDYSKQKSLKEKLISIHKAVANWYSERLFKQEGAAGLEYIRTREIPDDIITKFGLGFAPDSWDSITKLLTSMSYSQSEMLESGLVLRSESANRLYDRFRNRVTFPIWDEHGEIVGFSSRTILKETKEGKYINSPETLIFKKSKVLYAYHLAKKEIKERAFAILCEGQIDVISMHRAGFTNCVAPQGTAFTEDQARMLKRLTEKIYLCFDADNAGINAAIKALDLLLPLGIEVKIISLPEGEDPDSLFRKSGKESLQNAIDSASDFLDFMLTYLSKEKDISSPVVKSHIITEIFAKLSKIQDTILRSSYISVASDKLGIPANTGFEHIKLLNRSKNYQDGKIQRNPIALQPTTQKASPTNEAEKLLLRLIIEQNGGEIARITEENLPPELISSSPVGNAVNLAISMTINGEWEEIIKHLSLMVNDDPANAVIAQVLVHEDLPYKNNETRIKVCMDCIRSIKIIRIREKVELLTKELKNLESEEEKESKMLEISHLQKEQIQLKKN